MKGDYYLVVTGQINGTVDSNDLLGFTSLPVAIRYINEERESSLKNHEQMIEDNKNKNPSLARYYGARLNKYKTFETYCKAFNKVILKGELDSKTPPQIIPREEVFAIAKETH